MYLLFSDETNREVSSTKKFLIYGGIFMNAEDIESLSTSIRNVHEEFGFEWREQQFIKFNTNERPNSVTPEKHKNAKSKILETLNEFNVKVANIIVHHEITARKSESEKLEYTSGALFEAFHRYLEEKEDVGIVFADNWPTEGSNKFFSKLFCSGIEFYDRRRLDRIMVYSQTGVSHSFLASAGDVALGGLRYCVNNPEKTVAPRAILEKLLPLMWARVSDGTNFILQKGIDFRPREIRSDRIRGEYDAIKSVFKNHIDCINGN